MEKVNNPKRNIFIIGCKGLPARYGGFETFTDNLVSRQVSTDIQYYVACRSDYKTKQSQFFYHKAICQNIYVPNIGGASAILYDCKSLNWALETIDQNHLSNGSIYILGCTIGPLLSLFRNKFEQHGFKILLNPDGHEWKRDKWSYPVKKYLKFSEREMIRLSDLIICDSVTIQEYVRKDYARFNPVTRYLAYGSDINKSPLNADSYKVKQLFNKFHMKENNYYLVVGRFVPENNYETIIREFMRSKTKRGLVIVTNYQNSSFYDDLKRETNFNHDQRIKFIGTVYDANLLKYMRENAFAYIHGHSVGGTNPSLLEALGATKVNLLYSIGFNREVAGDSAFYWSKEQYSLAKLINQVDTMSVVAREKLSKKAKDVITLRYSWSQIISEYESLFLDIK